LFNFKKKLFISIKKCENIKLNLNNDKYIINV